MITLKAPIALKNRTDFINNYEGFNERIAGSYGLMGIEIGAEELLHIVNTPPEIYIADAGATTIVGNTLISSHNEEKLNIINNMLNRVMLSVSGNLTYQDRAYITSALYKLGIRDDRKFMNEVRQLIEESHLEEDFIDSYFAMRYDSSNAEIREETINLSREIINNGISERTDRIEQELSQSIMHRLQTGAIYQIVANFNKSLSLNRIDLAEQLVSEQENTARTILVQNLIRNMERDGVEFVYRREGEEGEGPDEAQIIRERITERAGEAGSSISVEQVTNEGAYINRSETRQGDTTNLTLDEAEIVYREEAGETGSTGEAVPVRERVTEHTAYVSDNIYERELSSIIRERITERTGEAGSSISVEQVTNEGAYINRSETRQGDTTNLTLDEAEIVYREETGETGSTGEEVPLRERVTERIAYVSDNIYERELSSEILNESRVTEEIGAAVLLDMVKNLYHAGYETINRGSTWMEYRRAIYHSSENTFNRVRYNAGDTYNMTDISEAEYSIQDVELAHTDLSELYETEENEENIVRIETQIREMNEMNLGNVERYEHMLEVLKKLTPKPGRVEGKDRTRREALNALEDAGAFLDSLRNAEDQQENERREVFREITRLFPDNAAQIFRIVEQYISNPSSMQGLNVSTNNIAQAADEIRRITLESESEPQPAPQVSTTDENELVFKRSDRLTAEEIGEVFENYRRVETRDKKETEDRQDVTETTSVNTTTVNKERSLSITERDDIEQLVNMGVRQQMGVISEQVLQKLEKRLRNEKSRRGI